LARPGHLPITSSSLTSETFARIRDLLLPTREELRWREIPWRASLVDAVGEAAASDKPILLWAMDGHPLGSTCGNGVLGRQSLWPDPALQALAHSFIPAADDAGALQRKAGRAGALFREVAEQGHYGGRTEPTDTRQGIYALTAGGTLLASTRTAAAAAVTEVLAAALERWHALSGEERRGRPQSIDVAPSGERSDQVPALVLDVYARDLPRSETQADGSHADAWNQDHMWLDREEVRRLVPDGPPGTRCLAPAAVASRIARFHLVDNVRGQTHGFDARAIDQAVLWSEVVAVADGTVTLRFEGEMRAHERGVWPVRDADDDKEPAPQERGYAMRLLGHGVFDRAHDRFTQLELVAAGDRWGGTQYNWRADDLGPAPMGVAFVLAEPGPMIPPALEPAVPETLRHILAR
jgi:hypothetical protein